MSVRDALRARMQKKLANSVAGAMPEGPAGGIAGMAEPVDTLTAGDATMRIDLANIERSSSTTGRMARSTSCPDAATAIGWIDPQGNPPAGTHS